MYLAMRLHIRFWYAWIESKANPSDGLSRVGAKDIQYGRIAVKGLSPGWHSLMSDTDRFADTDGRYGETLG